MTEAKTKPTKQSVAAFLGKIKDERQRADAEALVEMMREITKVEPVMWGTSIIGFGSYRYEYASGRAGDWPIAALSPRAQTLVVYIMPGFEEFEDLLAKLGKHKTGSSCLYLKRLADVHIPTLKKIVTKSVAMMKKKYG